MTDFETMSVDELIEWKLARKKEVLAIKATMREAHEVYTRKLVLSKLAVKLGIEVGDLSPKVAEELLALARKPKDGDVVVTPEHVTLNMKTGEVSA